MVLYDPYSYGLIWYNVSHSPFCFQLFEKNKDNAELKEDLIHANQVLADMRKREKELDWEVCSPVELHVLLI